jgi:tetratricopeptide (TPR) repeat protein
VTTTPQVPARAKGKRLLLLLLAAALLVGAAAGGYFAWRPRKPALPPIPAEGLDAEVAAAVAEARAGVEARPKSAAAWGHLGMVLFAQDMYVPCVPVLAEAQRLGPDNPRWPYFRGLALILEKPEEGLALLRRAADLAPEGLTPEGLTLHLRLAEESLKLDRTDEADALFRGLLVKHPNNPRALLGLGQVLVRRGRWQEALAPLKAAAEDQTARRSARVALAEAYLRLGETEEAAAEQKRAADTPNDLPWPDAFLAEARALRTGLQPRVDLALDLGARGQLREALTLAYEVLRDHPNSDEAHLTVAKLLIRAARYDEAEGELRQAIRLGPQLVEGHFLLAGVRMLRQDYPAAEAGFRRAVALKPAYGLAHHRLGECLLKQGKRAEALRAFRDAVRTRPDLAAAHLELGALLLEDGQVGEAVTHLDSAVRLDGKNERARRLLEQARAKKGPWRGAGKKKAAGQPEGWPAAGGCGAAAQRRGASGGGVLGSAGGGGGFSILSLGFGAPVGILLVCPPQAVQPSRTSGTHRRISHIFIAVTFLECGRTNPKGEARGQLPSWL